MYAGGVMRRGGYAKSVGKLIMWCIFLTLVIIIIYVSGAKKIEKVKENYTQLHLDVSRLTVRVQRLEHDILLSQPK